MEKKVVFLDVDGTMVNSKGIIPESAKEAVQKAKANGHKLVVCSGRSLFQVPKMLLDLGFSGIVGAAGAIVIADGKEIFHAHIDEEHRKSVTEYMNKNNITFCFQTDDGIVMTEENQRKMMDIMQEKGITKEHLEQLVGKFYIQKDVWNNDREEKIIYYEAPFPVSKVHEDLEPYFDAVQLSLSGSDEYSGEVGINGIHKATGMEIYLNHVGVTRENCIAIGDGPNDLQMMEYAGIGVAMGNAREDVKERANLVTTDIDEDGIYNAFEHLGLIS